MKGIQYSCKNKHTYTLFWLLICFVSPVFSQSNLPIHQVQNTLIKEVDSEHFLVREIRNMVLTSHSFSKKSAVAHYYFQQQFNDLPVYQAFLDVHLSSSNEILNFHHNFHQLDSNLQIQSFQLAPNKAIQLALKHLKLPYSDDLRLIEKKENNFIFLAPKISDEEILVSPKYYFSEKKELLPIWHFSILTLDAQHRWDLIVDSSNGKILEKKDMVLNCSFPEHKHEHNSYPTSKVMESDNFSFPEDEINCQYKIFPQPVENPNDGDRVMIINPADELASPFGWHDINGVIGHDYTITRGNNVYAHTDETGFNTTGFSPDGGEDLTFDFPFNLDQDNDYNKAAAVTNLFYWSNYMHDLAYKHGFDEEAGNFQFNNYDRGGIQGDFIIADAQDQGGRNNANFSCGPDGSRGRIQMYLWDNENAGVQFHINDGFESNDYKAIEAQFGAPLTAEDVEAPLAFASNTLPNLACDPVENNLEGKIAFIDRGNCLFINKIYHVQEAGAIACVVCNNNSSEPFAMGGENDEIQIPSVMISKSDCDIIKQQMQSGEVILNLSNDPSQHDIDSDFDNAVIAHEYAHGISLRLTGGASVVNCLTNAEQMGEGWSDFFALITTMKEEDNKATPRTIGTYILNQDLGGSGLRPSPYSTDMSINPATYEDIKYESTSHKVGYVWASMLWDLAWEIFKEHGRENGKDILLDLVIEGMKFLPCHPGFVEARDAIFLADQALFDGAHEAHIWRAFAKRGLGYSADQGSPHSVTDGVSAFDYPPCMFPNAYCSSQVVYLGPYGGAFLSAALLDNGSTDCNGPLNYSVEEQAFLYLDCQDIGVKEVSLEVTNTLGVSSYCQTNVIVFDTISPLAICQSKEVNLSYPIITVEEMAGYSVDNCTPKENLTYNFETITFTEDDLGKNQFEIIVQDASGNTNSCLSVVNVTTEVSPLQSDKQDEKQNEVLDKKKFSLKDLGDFQVFPNPAQDWFQLNVDIPLENGTIFLYNSKGEKVLETAFQSNNYSEKINVQSLPSGVYFIQLQSSSQKTTKKLIIQ